jgi:hypothetical protein
MANTVTIPTATGDLAAFLTGELLPSIPPVNGSGSSANPAEQHNQYVLPTAVAITLPPREADPSLDAFRKELADMAARQSRTELAQNCGSPPQRRCSPCTE